jgi:hypothetical protein
MFLIPNPAGAVRLLDEKMRLKLFELKGIPWDEIVRSVAFVGQVEIVWNYWFPDKAKSVEVEFKIIVESAETPREAYY